MSEEQQPSQTCRNGRRTERRTRSAKEIELEIRRRERERERRFADRGDGRDSTYLRSLAVLSLAARGERPSYR